MIQLFSLGGLLRFFGVFLLAGALLVAAMKCATGYPVKLDTVQDAIRFASFSLSAGSALLLVVGHHHVVSGLWRIFPFLSAVAPNLNGAYELRTSSNWPLKQQMLKSYQGHQPDVRIPDSRLDELQVFDGVLRVELGMLRLKMTYEPAEKVASRSSSEVISSTMRRNPDSGRFEIAYVFTGRVLEPTQTDEQAYYGAAMLTVNSEPGRVTGMEGTYWTNRSWRKGLNTAGIATAIRKA